MITWGINALNHDVSIAVFEESELKRFETVKGVDRDSGIIHRALDASSGRGPSVIAWYERPWLKKTRQLYAGQYDAAFDMGVIPRRWLNSNNLSYAKVKYFPHHKSHAAAGFFTSPFDDATIVVLDAMGEWESASIWQGRGTNLKKVWSRNYPNSLGIFYSAFTQLIGYKPVLEEYLLQRDSEKGNPKKYYNIVKGYFDGVVSLRYNLHCGVLDWPKPIASNQDKYDIAAAVQQVFEEQADMVMLMARRLSNSRNLVYMGGCAMNSKYNQYLGTQWDNVWTLPNPGDPSSAIGAALLSLNTRITLPRNFNTCY
jgi:carbamoyltransferase